MTTFETEKSQNAYIRKLSIVFGITWGLCLLDRFMIGYMAPGFMEELGLDFTKLGLLAMVSGFGSALGCWIIGGPFTEYYGRRKGSVWANLIQTLISAATGLVQSFGQMIGVRFLMGFGMGSMYPPSFAAISEESPPEKRGFWMGFTQSFGPLIASVIGPVVAGYLLESIGWRYGFFIMVIPGTVMILWLAKFMREPSSIAANIKARKETGKKVLLHQNKEYKLWDVFKYRNIILMTIVSICCMAYLIILVTFMPSFFSEVHGFTPVQFGWIMGASSFLSFLAQIFGPLVSDRIGRKPVLIVLFSLGTLGGVLFALAPPGTHPALLILYLTLFTAGLASYPLYLIIIPSESVPFTIAATAIAVPQGFGEVIGSSIFPAIAGRIADAYGLRATMWMVVVFSLIALITTFFAEETAPNVVKEQVP